MIIVWIAAIAFGLIGLAISAWYMRDEYFYTGRIFGYTLWTGLLWGLVALGIVGIVSTIPTEPVVQRDVAYEYTTLRGDKGVAKTCRENASGVLTCETTNHTTVLVSQYREVEIEYEN